MASIEYLTKRIEGAEAKIEKLHKKLDRIEKGYDQKEQKQYLDLFPFDDEQDTLFDEWEECGRCYRVYFDEPTKCEKFVKDILLDGCADLSKV